ncbi:cyclic nucleotide-binding domain-containing protein [Pedococcus sp. P5_B7]
MDAQELASIPLLADLTTEQRAMVAEKLSERQVDVGTVLAREGDYAYSLFFVVDGLAAAAHDTRLLTTLRPGDWFGEIGVLTHSTRSANVVALSTMRLLTLMAWDFSDLMQELPVLGNRIRERALERLERD